MAVNNLQSTLSSLWASYRKLPAPVKGVAMVALPGVGATLFAADVFEGIGDFLGKATQDDFVKLSSLSAEDQAEAAKVNAANGHPNRTCVSLKEATVYADQHPKDPAAAKLRDDVSSKTVSDPSARAPNPG